MRLDPLLGELIEYVEWSRRGVRRNGSHFAPCGQMGADSCSSRVALRALRLRVLGVIGSAAWLSPPPGVVRGVRYARGIGTDHAEDAENAEDAAALRQTLPDFLVTTRATQSLAQCIVERQDPDTLKVFRLASSRKKSAPNSALSSMRMDNNNL